MIVDLAQNPKQELFYNTAIEAVYGLNNYRILSYGGAIRGGKSFVSLAFLFTVAKQFPNSRWHIFRSDFPALSSTTIPSAEKIISGSSNWGWNRDKSNYFCYHRKSESKIFFKAENISQDPELNNLLGLETNGILYEQVEELSEKLFNMGMSRNGSWYIPKMPKPITILTFNPTQTWVKDKIYVPYLEGKLQAPYYFLSALPKDNKFVTEEQWNAWELMADRYQKQFIEGDWTDFGSNNNLWAFAFSEAKHSGAVERNDNEVYYLSFDFNKNPISCSVIQHYRETIHVVETVKLSNSDIYALCNYIKSIYSGALFIVTGDSTGRNTTALVKDNLNFYKVIKAELSLLDTQIQIPGVNPPLADNQVLVNSLLSNYNIIIDKDKAKHLIFDLKNVKTMPDGTIEKRNREDPTQQADALDTFRYYCNKFHGNFLKRGKA